MEDMIKLQPSKDSNGEAWEFKCNENDRLQKIYISHSSDSIDFIQFVRVHGGQQFASSGYGIASGNKFNVVELGITEELTSVSGHHEYDFFKGKYVLRSITFGTDKSMIRYGQRAGSMASKSPEPALYGPYGGCPAAEDMMMPDNGLKPDNGLEFKFEMGRSFGGFHGTTVDGKLESIGVFIRVV